MTDRNVQHPRRYQQDPVPGTTNIFDFTPAPGEVYEEGTIINKATLLKDATAALFGLGTDAVPDDVLAWLGKYNQYWWRRKSTDWEISIGSVSKQVTLRSVNGNYLDTYYDYEYSSEVSVDSSGTISLVSPQTVSISFYDTSAGSALAGNFFKTSDGVIWKAAADASVGRPASIGSSNPVYVSSAFSVSALAPNEREYLYSSDRNAYPDSGVQDGYEYEYLGIPFENAVGAPKIETGSYVGTGTYGESGATIINTTFKPRAILLKDHTNIYGVGYASMGNDTWLFTDALTSSRVAYQYSSTRSANLYFTWGDNYVSWATDATSNGPQVAQFNDRQYDYVVIG